MKPFSNYICFIVLVFCVFTLIGYVTAQQESEQVDPQVIDLPILSIGNKMVSNFQIKVTCSDTKLRTGVATLIWRTDEPLYEKQRLDVTIYKKGFKKNIHTFLWPLRKDQKFQNSKLNKQQDRPFNQSLYLNVQEIAVDKEKGTISVKLEGLEPGLNYFWRVLTLREEGWAPTKTLRCRTPICPADIKNKR